MSVFDTYDEEDLAAGALISAGGYGTTFSSPDASIVGDWGGTLKSFGDFVGGVAKTYTGIVGARDDAMAKADDTAFNRFLKKSQIDLAKYQITKGGDIEKARLDAQLAAARSGNSFFGVPAAAGNTFLIIAGVGLVVVLVMKMRK